MSALEEVLHPKDTETKPTETEQSEDTTTEDTGEKTEVKEVKTESSTPEEKETVPKAALLDERRKRQDLEKQLAKQEPKEKISVFDNEDEALAQVKNEVLSEVNNRFLNMSEANARSRHDDFQAKYDLFFDDLVTDNPALIQQALSQPDPFEFVYTHAKSHAELKELGDPEAWKKTERSRLKAEILQELKGEQAAEIEKRLQDGLPPTLANQTAAGGNKNAPYQPPSLDQVLQKK